ncbi:GlsB/YeaQ/YmgE family stress response membrane protein [Luteipulveratus sp. YIM 133132]|uniref:GlsB/YeaQ/YmgE family stress response membrane protein n=1 Tax=Luteipulveratus flavus TaxID=3031728 RepID=UPI0023B15660|nr:GlsB/YeaQ/YmgE family stress response membrane protein [Luteipulveratus sp. YIM 133132]MDE9365832.1 GlsB/YeaQ/YmgE family stress response membrane protein [Luteipulveratus sp. YIM 133132]
MIGDIIGYIVIGAIIGAVARLALPGKQAIGWAATIIIGIIGAFIGGMIVSALSDKDHNIIAFIVSVIVAAVGVSLYAGMQARRVGGSSAGGLSGSSRTR